MVIWQTINAHRSTIQIFALSSLSRSSPYISKNYINFCWRFINLFVDTKQVTNKPLNLEYGRYVMIYLPSFRIKFMKLQALTAASVSCPGMKIRKCVKATFSEFILSFYYDGWCLQRILWSSGYTVTVRPPPEHKHSIHNVCYCVQWSQVLLISMLPESCPRSKIRFYSFENS